MPAEHMDLPAQATACIISGLEPSDVSQGWNPTDGNLLAEAATNKVLQAVVKGVVCGMVEVDLYDRAMYLQHGVSTPLLYQSLIDRGYMKLNLTGEDSAGKDESAEDENAELETGRSWADRVELVDPQN